MKSSIRNAALAAVSTLVFTKSVVAGLSAAEYQGCYSSSYPLYTNSSLSPYIYQSSGWCQEQCGTYAQKAVFGLTDGSDCWCGNELPANSTKVSDDECNVGCQGYGTQDCGGTDTWSVYTSGLTTDVDSVSDDAASSAAASTAASSTTTTSASATTHAVTTVSGSDHTIVITATPTAAQSSSSASSSSSSSSKSSSGGTSTAGIAAGVVVGIVAIAAIAGGAFFYVRHRKRKAIEADHQRQQTINSFQSGTIKSERSGTDSRLDPAIQYRRQSDGSIADETDFSRRVLKVSDVWSVVLPFIANNPSGHKPRQTSLNVTI